MFQAMVNLAIVDDHTLFRAILKNYLQVEKNINVIFDSDGQEDFLLQLTLKNIDVLLLDLMMPNFNVYDTITLIKQRHQNIRLIIVSMCTDFSVINNLLDAGIHGYVSKTDDIETLIQTIIASTENRIYKSKILTEALYKSKQTNFANKSSHVYFDDREKKILQLLWEEKSNREIGDELFLGVRTVEKIRQHMKEKVGAKSSLGLLKYALKTHIINQEYIQ